MCIMKWWPYSSPGKLVVLTFACFFLFPSILPSSLPPSLHSFLPSFLFRHMWQSLVHHQQVGAKQWSWQLPLLGCFPFMAKTLILEWGAIAAPLLIQICMTRTIPQSPGWCLLLQRFRDFLFRMFLQTREVV